MALAYPEGECFFVRSALTTKQPEGYHADKADHFYRHMMVEYLWNVEADHGSDANSPRGFTHPRSGYKIVRGSGWHTDYGNWTHLPFSYGPTESDIRRRLQHNLCTNGNRFRDHEKGGSAEAWFMTMPIPTSEERWVWIDMLGYIRAIYLPVAQSTDKDYQHISTWVQINFALDRVVKIWRGGESFDGHQCNRTFGLRVCRGYTVGINVYGLLQLLNLPRQLRKANAYNSKMIKIVPNSGIRTVHVATSYTDNYDFDWTAIAKANFGLELQWKPTQKSTWLANFLQNVLTIALGLIPVVGPILAVAFPLGWTALTDPDSFFDQLKTLVPAVDLTDQLVKQIKKDIEETKALIPSGWDQAAHPMQSEILPEGAAVQDAPPSLDLEEIGRSLSFIMAGETLEASGGKYPDIDQREDEGEVVVENQPTDNPSTGDQQPTEA